MEGILEHPRNVPFFQQSTKLTTIKDNVTSTVPFHCDFGYC